MNFVSTFLILVDVYVYMSYAPLGQNGLPSKLSCPQVCEPHSPEP